MDPEAQRRNLIDLIDKDLPSHGVPAPKEEGVPAPEEDGVPAPKEEAFNIVDAYNTALEDGLAEMFESQQGGAELLLTIAGIGESAHFEAGVIRAIAKGVIESRAVADKPEAWIHGGADGARPMTVLESLAYLWYRITDSEERFANRVAKLANRMDPGSKTILTAEALMTLWKSDPMPYNGETTRVQHTVLTYLERLKVREGKRDYMDAVMEMLKANNPESIKGLAVTATYIEIFKAVEESRSAEFLAFTRILEDTKLSIVELRALHTFLSDRIKFTAKKNESYADYGFSVERFKAGKELKLSKALSGIRYYKDENDATLSVFSRATFDKYHTDTFLQLRTTYNDRGAVSKLLFSPATCERVGKSGSGAFGQVTIVRYRGSDLHYVDYAVKVVKDQDSFQTENKAYRNAYTELARDDRTALGYTVLLDQGLQTDDLLKMIKAAAVPNLNVHKVIIMSTLPGGVTGSESTGVITFETVKRAFTGLLLISGTLLIHGYAYQDHKLENLVYTSSTVKLIDFGCLRAATRDNGCSTPIYSNIWKDFLKRYMTNPDISLVFDAGEFNQLNRTHMFKTGAERRPHPVHAEIVSLFNLLVTMLRCAATNEPRTRRALFTFYTGILVELAQALGNVNLDYPTNRVKIGNLLIGLSARQADAPAAATGSQTGGVLKRNAAVPAGITSVALAVISILSALLTV